MTSMLQQSYNDLMNEYIVGHIPLHFSKFVRMLIIIIMTIIIIILRDYEILG